MTEQFNHASNSGEQENTESLLDKLRLGSSHSEFTQAENGDFTSNENLSEELDETDEDIKQLDSLPNDARRALVNLMRQGVVLSSNKPKIFEIICVNQQLIRRYLEQIYLSLILDEKAGIAFIASYQNEFISDNESAPDIDSESISLINRRTLSLYDSLLLLVLRKHFRDRENAGEQKVIIDIDRVDSYLTPFLPLTNNSKSDRKKLTAAIQRMLSQKILSTVKGSDERFEITPVIRYVVNAEFLESMLNEYTEIAENLRNEKTLKPELKNDNLTSVTEGF